MEKDILSLALRTLPDLTGDDLALVLKAAVSARDNPSQLEATLKSVLSVVTTSGPLRLALRRHFTAQEILPIFEILDQWLHLAEDALTDDIPPLSAVGRHLPVSAQFSVQSLIRARLDHRFPSNFTGRILRHSAPESASTRPHQTPRRNPAS